MAEELARAAKEPEQARCEAEELRRKVDPKCSSPRGALKQGAPQVTRFDFSEDLLLPWVRWSTGFAVGLVLGTGYYWLDLHLSKAPSSRIYDFSLPLPTLPRN